MIKHIFKLIWNKKASNALLILEIFLSFLVLFFTVAYMIFNLGNVNKPLGYDIEDRWIIRLDNKLGLKDSLEKVTIMHNLKQDLLADPDVEQVTFTQSICYFTQNNWRNSLSALDGTITTDVDVFPVDLQNKDLMNVQLKEGRWFTEDDMMTPTNEIIVNQLFVDRTFPGVSIIDSVFDAGGEDYKVIGVVEHIRYRGAFEEPFPTLYKLEPYYNNTDNAVIKLTANTPADAEERIWNTVNSTTKLTANIIQPMDKRRDEMSRHNWVLLIALMTICGFLCVNVALGLFGVLSYSISKRRGEIGLRQAMGATSGNITSQFITETFILTALAVGLGVFFTIQIPLFDVTEYEDALFYKAIIYTLLIIFGLVFLCALLPSIQASKIRPAIALHED